MMRRLLPLLLLIFLVPAMAANAQYGPGSGSGRGHGGQGRSPSGGGSSGPTAAPAAPPVKPPKPTNQIEIVGVVQSLDPANERVTITYEPVDGLNWPAGTMPFTVYNADLLKTVTVGERVRFKLDAQQITELTPY